MISLDQAHHHIGKLQPLAPLTVSLDEALGLVCADETHARTDCPSVDASLKDGFAVVSSDIAAASPSNPVTLTVEGSLTAGDAAAHCRVKSGTTVRIMTGAPLPCGATSVLASEFAQVEGDHVTIWADAGPGRNILCKGSDIALGQVVLEQGEILGPTHLGLLAAAGLNKVTCYPRPRVAVAATGSELVWPGEPVSPGKIAASNMVTVAAELKALGISAAKVLLRDNLDNLQEQFRLLVDQADVVITCGGVLDGDKDLTLRAMEAIGMEKIFHRVRIGPGKGACMGRVGSTVVFNLPGGPPSNHVALLLLALPGVRRLMGCSEFLPPKRVFLVGEELRGQRNWTQMIYGHSIYKQGSCYAVPLLKMGRLEALAAANLLIEIPEGISAIGKGTVADAWVFREHDCKGKIYG